PVYERDALEVVIYSFPGGWEDLPGDRVVDGHFPQVREAELTRLLRAHNSEVKEIRHDSQPLSGLEYPVAASSFVVEGARPATGSLLLLSAARPLFLRLRLA